MTSECQKLFLEDARAGFTQCFPGRTREESILAWDAWRQVQAKELGITDEEYMRALHVGISSYESNLETA